MSKTIVVTLTEEEAKRLAKTDWGFSVGWGVRVPGALVRVENKIRGALERETGE